MLEHCRRHSSEGLGLRVEVNADSNGRSGSILVSNGVGVGRVYFGAQEIEGKDVVGVYLPVSDEREIAKQLTQKAGEFVERVVFACLDLPFGEGNSEGFGNYYEVGHDDNGIERHEWGVVLNRTGWRVGGCSCRSDCSFQEGLPFN